MTTQLQQLEQMTRMTETMGRIEALLVAAEKDRIKKIADDAAISMGFRKITSEISAVREEARSFPFRPMGHKGPEAIDPLPNDAGTETPKPRRGLSPEEVLKRVSADRERFRLRSESAQCAQQPAHRPLGLGTGFPARFLTTCRDACKRLRSLFLGAGGSK
jgi:hypothetical protein